MSNLIKSLLTVCFFLGFVHYGSAQKKESKAIIANPVELSKAIKVNLLSPFWGSLTLAYQQVIRPNASIQITASYMDFDSYGSTSNRSYNQTSGYKRTVVGNATIEETTTYTLKNQRTQGFSITPEFRSMLNGRGLSGIYIAPFMRYMYYKHTAELTESVQTYTQLNVSPFTSNYNYSTRESEQTNINHTVGLGLIIGKQILYKNKVVIDGFIGPTYAILVQSNYPVSSTSEVRIGQGIPNLYVKGYGLRAGFTIGLAR